MPDAATNVQWSAETARVDRGRRSLRGPARRRCGSTGIAAALPIPSIDAPAAPAGLRALAAGEPTRDGRRPIIVEADDLGLVYAFNEGVRSAALDGVLTSTCLRANGYAYEHAVAQVLPACPHLGVGVHLCLNEAEPVALRERVGGLLDARGALRSGFVWLMRAAQKRAGLHQIEIELRAQIERVLRDGVRVDHLNSHQHVHMIPPIFRLVCRLAREYGVGCVRLVRELPYAAGGLLGRLQPFFGANFIKHALLNRFARINAVAAAKFGILTTDYFVGVSYTARMHLPAVLEGLRAAPHGSVEVLLHPAVGPDPRDARYPTRELEAYVRSPRRAMELESLRSPRLREFLDREGCVLTHFGAWARQSGARRPAERTPPIAPELHAACSAVRVRCPPWVSAAQDDSRAFAELAAALTVPGQRVLDVGTGTGIVAICLAKLGREAVAVDVSRAAVRTAEANAARNDAVVACRVSDLLSQVAGRFDLIAFNPPYGFGPDNLLTAVAKHALRKLPFVRRRSGLAIPRPVLRYHQQLVARLFERAREHLHPGGGVLLHAYESEVEALARVLPPESQIELLRHEALAQNRTVGMLIR